MLLNRSYRLFLFLSLIAMNVNSQHLFGNPSCDNWHHLATAEKITWLNAFLVPLNLTNVSRKKPKVDKFSHLSSLDPAVRYVDIFCNSESNALAAVGAMRFLEELTQEP
jgi:hypothetical protein